MQDIEYLMESDEEDFRLDIKTKSTPVKKQARWAGIKPGMRVADIGCGSGKTTSILHKLVQPGGIVVGMDGSEKRIAYAKEHYADKGVEFICKDIRESFDIGLFDFVWIRFLLEYYKSSSFEIVRNISKILKPGGILCLIDLDYNCLTHYDLPKKLERTLFSLMEYIEKNANFDPYIGRKLYSFLYDIGYHDINVNVMAHHLIFGELKDNDSFNWIKKIEILSKKIKYQFDEYEKGYEEFLDEFKQFFSNPRRFTYTPIILCKGRRPIP